MEPANLQNDCRGSGPCSVSFLLPMPAENQILSSKGGNQVQVLSTRRLKAPQGPIGAYHTPVLGRTPLRPWLAREALPFES